MISEKKEIFTFKFQANFEIWAHQVLFFIAGMENTDKIRDCVKE